MGIIMDDQVELTVTFLGYSDDIVKAVSRLMKEFFTEAYKSSNTAWPIIHKIIQHYPEIESSNSDYRFVMDRIKKFHAKQLRLAIARRLIIGQQYSVGIFEKVWPSGYIIMKVGNRTVKMNPLTVDRSLQAVYNELNPYHF